MQASDLPRAVSAARSIASGLGLAVDDAVVVHDSNRIAVRLLPCDVLARVAHAGDRAATFEVELAQRLAATDSPVAALEPRVEPLVYEADGFAVTLWTYEPHSPEGVSVGDYARALERLHAGMQGLDIDTPRYSDRVAEALAIVGEPDRSPGLEDADRELLITALRRQQRAIDDRCSAEQLLHGEPHPGNVLATRSGPLFIDIETCCRGPVEFDLAHVPEAVCERYPRVDQALLDECRGLVLAMVAAWRSDREDQLPNGRRAGDDLLAALRKGPPWPALTTLMPTG
jgi:hypothetical protein